MITNDVAVYKGELEGVWLAQGLTDDVLAQGSSPQLAYEKYHVTLEMELAERRKGIFGPLPKTPFHVREAAIKRAT